MMSLHANLRAVNTCNQVREQKGNRWTFGKCHPLQPSSPHSLLALPTVVTAFGHHHTWPLM